MLQMAVQQQMAIHQEDYVTLSNCPHITTTLEDVQQSKEKISLAIADQYTEVKDERKYMTIYPKVHAHVRLNQMNIGKDYKPLVRRGTGQL